jgi:hypothetical protein
MPAASELGSWAVILVPSFIVMFKRHDAPRKLAAATVALPDLLATTSTLSGRMRAIPVPEVTEPGRVLTTLPRTSIEPPETLPEIGFVNPTNSATNEVLGRS